jgi:branched-chain amino acid transport system substrate-binding protein
MRKILGILLVGIMVFALVGCGGSNNTDTPSEPEEILIGNIQDLSGPTAVWGSGMKWAAEKAAEEINANGGINGKEVRIITYDNKNDVNEAINIYNRLVEQDNVVAVIGPPNSNVGIALAPVAEDAKVPLWGYFMDERATTDEAGNPYGYMFLGQLSSNQQSEIMASYALNDLGITKVAILYDQSLAYSVTHAEPFAEWFEANGGEIVAKEAFQQGEMDYRVQLSKMIDAEPEALFITSYVQQNSIAYKQAREMGFTGTILGNNSFFIPFASLVNDEAYDVHFPVNISFEDENFKPFVDMFVEEFNEMPALHIAFGYDAVLAITDAITRADSLDTTAIRDALLEVKDLVGYTGSVTINPENHRPLDLTMFVTRVENEKYIPVGRFGPPQK